MLICSRYTKFKTGEGEMILTAEGFTRARVHLARGLVDWANKSKSNMSRLNRLLNAHANKLASTRRTSGELITSRDFSGADTAHVTSELRGRSTLSWAAFASEF